jgi:hypothetical protein
MCFSFKVCLHSVVARVVVVENVIILPTKIQIK